MGFFKISSAFPYSDATVASATTLGDLAPPSDNSSVKSLRINFERGSDMRPTASVFLLDLHSLIFVFLFLQEKNCFSYLIRTLVARNEGLFWLF